MANRRVKWKQWQIFFWGTQNHCRWWLFLLLGRKAMSNLGSILTSRDITLPTKVHLVKAMVFPVVMNRCESWTITKAESQRIDAFELWCWRRLLRVPWTARRSNQSILKEISPEYSLGELMLKLKLQHFGHLMWRTDSFEKIWCWERLQKKGMTEGEMVGWHHWLWGLKCEWVLGVGDGQGSLACCSPWGCKSRARLSDWTELNWSVHQWTMHKENVVNSVLLITTKDRPSSQLLQSKEACPCGRQYWVSAESEMSLVFLCTGFSSSIKALSFRVNFLLVDWT